MTNLLNWFSQSAKTLKRFCYVRRARLTHSGFLTVLVIPPAD